MLYQAGELAKFGYVPAVKVYSMQHSQDAPDSAFLRQNRFKDLAWAASILISTRHEPEASAYQICQFRAKIESALLCKLECSHHLLRLCAKKIAARWIQLFVLDKERVADGSFVRSDQRKKTKKSTRLARDISAHKLLRDALRHPQDISRVPIVVSHQRLAAELAVPRKIMQSFCDLFLQVDMQYVGRAPGRIMQVRAQTEEEIVSSLDPSLIAFAKPIFSYELVHTQRPLFEVVYPKQILIIAQSTTSVLEVGLLQIDAVAEFFVPGELVLHPHFNIFAFESIDTF